MERFIGAIIAFSCIVGYSDLNKLTEMVIQNQLCELLVKVWLKRNKGVWFCWLCDQKVSDEDYYSEFPSNQTQLPVNCWVKPLFLCWKSFGFFFYNQAFVNIYRKTPEGKVMK